MRWLILICKRRAERRLPGGSREVAEHWIFHTGIGALKLITSLNPVPFP